MHDAFMRTIVANPDDDAPRLVYADWLDETGDPANADRAEFIRLQIRLDTLPADDPQRPKLAKRETTLLKRYAKKWAKPFREIVTWWTFRRGFIESAVVRTEGMGDTFTDLFRGLVEGTPLREVCLFQQTDDIGCLLSAAPLMKRLRSFSVRHGFLDSSGHILRTLFESKHLAGLRRLELECDRNGTWFRPRTLSALLQSPALRKLTDLSVSNYITSLHPTVVRTLARSESLANLTRLRTESTHFDRTSIRGILRADYAPNLETLDLRHCTLDRGAWKELLSPKVLSGLTRLFLAGASIDHIAICVPGKDAERLIAQVGERFGADAVDIEQEFPARSWYYSWWQK